MIARICILIDFVTLIGACWKVRKSQLAQLAPSYLFYSILSEHAATLPVHGLLPDTSQASPLFLYLPTTYSAFPSSILLTIEKLAKMQTEDLPLTIF